MKKIIISEEQYNQIVGESWDETISAENDSEAPEFEPNAPSFPNTADGAENTDKIADDGVAGSGTAPWVRAVHGSKGIGGVVYENNQALNGINITAVFNDGSSVQGSESLLAKNKSIAKKNGDKEAYNKISIALKNRREPIERAKENRRRLGIPNSEIKPHTKNSGNGKAHSPKKDNNNGYIIPKE